MLFSPSLHPVPPDPRPADHSWLSVYERRVGHLRTLVVAIGGQFFGALLTALFLWPFEDTGWSWARELATARDLGISAGGFALIGALTAVDAAGVAQRGSASASAPTCSRWSSTPGLLWDVEHFVAFSLGVFAGPFLARPAAGRSRGSTSAGAASAPASP